MQLLRWVRTTNCWPNPFLKASELVFDVTTATQYWLDAFCFFFPSCWHCFSHSYSFPAVLYLTRSSQCEGMAALWFMGLLSLPLCLHSLCSNKTAKESMELTHKMKTIFWWGKEGIKRDPSRFRCCKHICRVTIKQWLQRSAFQNVS